MRKRVHLIEFIVDTPQASAYGFGLRSKAGVVGHVSRDWYSPSEEEKHRDGLRVLSFLFSKLDFGERRFFVHSSILEALMGLEQKTPLEKAGIATSKARRLLKRLSSRARFWRQEF